MSYLSPLTLCLIQVAAYSARGICTGHVTGETDKKMKDGVLKGNY